MGLEAWLWLANGLGFGAQNAGELLAACPGGANEVLARIYQPEIQSLLAPAQAKRFSASKPQDFVTQLETARREGIQPLAYDDPDYPELLRLTSAPPPVLYVKGDKSLLNGCLTMGIVGTRTPSSYGVEAVRLVGRQLAAAGVVVVSGLAAGLDAEAHKAALAAEGYTVACIAFGHDHCYPAANRRLMEMVERYGAVVSEYPLGVRGERPFFLQRNRLIAALSHGLLVAEARQHSGTMSTVNFAAEYGREVFAIPGSILSPLSSGTNNLIREGASLAAGAEDVLSVFGFQAAPLPKGVKPEPLAYQPRAWHRREKSAPLPIHQPREQAAEQLVLQPPPVPVPIQEESNTPLQPGLGQAAAQEEIPKTPLPEREAVQPATAYEQEPLWQAPEQAFSPDIFPERTQSKLPAGLSERARLVYNSLGAAPISLDEVCLAAGLAPGQAMGALTELELEGYARQLAGRQFVAVR